MSRDASKARSAVLVIGLAAVIAATGCSDASAPGNRTGAMLGDTVTTFGLLHEVMMENDTTANVSLAALTPDSLLYGVGALSGLRGEVTILAGRVHHAYPDDEFGTREVVADTSAESAALLVAARVERWTDVPIEEPIAFDALEARVAEMAAGAGVDMSRPFPFVIEGPMRSIAWHVIDGRRLTPGATGHDAHLAASARRTLPLAGAVLLGFYSTAHEGVFTHMGSRTHVHAVFPAATASGHLDGVLIEPGATLRVPAP
jgi:acetolactate decarboxylase